MKRLALLIPLALATPASAAPHPPILPQQDIQATYSLSTPGRAPAEYDLNYSASAQRARITDPIRGLTFLIDIPSGQAELIVPALHAIVDAPDIANLTQIITSAGGAKFLAIGPGRYAGLQCDKYEVLAAQGAASTCITPSGVILHFDGHDPQGSATVTATSVTFTPQPPESFLPPSGYARIQLAPGTLAQLLQ